MAILAVDQGTTGTTCMLYNPLGELIARTYREITQIYPCEGWVEHDPEEIWRSVADGMNELAAASSQPVTAIGITNQRETTILWDRVTGKPVRNAIVWQCRRTSELCRRYEEYRERIASKTGLPLDAYFSATKIRWILDHTGNLDPARLLFGTVDSWLIWKLTGGKVHATDFTNASRTLLFNIREKRWDRELLDLFEVPETMLPEVIDSMGDFGKVSVLEKLRDVPIAAVAGDQQAAMFGQCCWSQGTVKNTYGTGCFMVMNTGDTFIESRNGLLTTLAIDAEGRPCYALEGSVFIGGAVIQWLRDELQILSHAADSDAMARELSSNGGVYLVPAFVGLGAPHWQPQARGTIVGLTRGSGRSHIVRAALESIAYQSHDVFKAMVADSGIFPASLMVDGGAADNEFLMQFQADLLGVPVLRPLNIESTAFGAATLAGLKTGVWKSAGELESMHQQQRTFLPSMEPQERLHLLAGWTKALSQTLAK